MSKLKYGVNSTYSHEHTQEAPEICAGTQWGLHGVEVLTAMYIKIQVVWDVATCPIGLLNPEDEDTMITRNDGKYQIGNVT